MPETLKILIIRNDKLGDFMLAWPAFSLLKKHYPNCKITALVPEYTAPMAKQCEWIDTVLIDTKQKSFIGDVFNLSGKIKEHHFDASISLYSELRTSSALWLAGVKTRIGPATKLAQIFLNKKLRQKRSLSSKPEYEYNLDLIRYYMRLNGKTSNISPAPPYLKFDNSETEALKHKYLKLYNIPDSAKIIIIHPGTGGSAINLSLEQYAQLAQTISKRIDAFFIITSGPNEFRITQQLSTLLQEVKHCTHQSTEGIIGFCKFIGLSDLFISGSTGPLHIAGALNVRTATFYPSSRSATALRWQTINEDTRRLAITAKNNDMSSIDINIVARNVINFLQEKPATGTDTDTTD